MDEVQRLALEGEASVEPLVALLSEASWVVRRAVVAALARIGTPAVGALCGVLAANRSDEMRLAATVDALVASGGNVEPAVLALAERRPEPAIICDVAQVLGRRKSRNCIPPLARWTKHEDDNVAVAAIEALGRIGGPAALDPLLEAVSSGNFFRTFPAIAFLGQSRDPRVVDALSALLDQQYYVTEAATALGRTGHVNALEPLARLLVHESDVVVRTAARALVELRHRHAERFGHSDAVLASFRAMVAPETSKRASMALVKASASEKVALACVLGWLHDETAVTTLVSLLDGDPATANEAFDALRTLGPEVNEPIRKAIATGSSDTRARLLPLLGARRSAVPELILCLRDDDPNVRALAADALGRTADTSAAVALFGVIGDADARVAQSAVGAIQSLGSDETKSHAIQSARAADPRTRRAALRIISYFGYPEALDVLLEAIADADERIRDAAMTGLALLENPRATAALLVALGHESAGTRAAACRSLASAVSTADIRGGLTRALADSDAWVRYYACQSIGKLHVTDAAAEVATLLDDAAGQVRVAAVESVAKLGGQRALEVLKRAAQGDDPDVRRAALLGLANIRRPEAFPVLLAAAESDDAGNRLVALSALAEMTTPEADGALMRAGSDPDENVRSAAVALLSTRGPAATRWLIERLSREDEREQMLAALGRPAEGRIETVLSALESADESTATSLVEALLRMRRPNGNAAVEAALHLDNVSARRAAASGLAGLGTPSARAALALSATADEDAEVRRIAADGA